ncbi:MAG TPA: hypothetical protein DCG51_09475 [Erysipelotrichaceae bacterium]|nr:hypothetical protein [Solobacterium sp.]HAE16766.1 hypothetical protein [Erysipelotrichaceae bacterium]
MTKDYAYRFWTGLFRLLRTEPESRVMENPAAAFAEKAKAGAFDSLSDEEYEAQLNDVEQENALFGYQKFATSYVIMLKALRRLELNDTEMHTLLRILINASVRTDFRKEREVK